MFDRINGKSISLRTGGHLQAESQHLLTNLNVLDLASERRPVQPANQRLYPANSPRNVLQNLGFEDRLFLVHLQQFVQVFGCGGQLQGQVLQVFLMQVVVLQRIEKKMIPDSLKLIKHRHSRNFSNAPPLQG